MLLLAAAGVGLLLWISLGPVSDDGGQPLPTTLRQPDEHTDRPAETSASKTEIKPVVRQVRFVAKNKLDSFRSALLLLLYPGSSTISHDMVENTPATLMEEDPEFRKYYRALLNEKQRWDRYRQRKYHDVLETTQEPARLEQPEVKLQNEANRLLLSDLVQTLQLHTQLVRDVRMFHDEVSFKEQRVRDGYDYRLYEHKYRLAPFAREAALADALQQALSALSAGLHQEEAQEVIERLSEEYTRPVQRLYEQLGDTGSQTAPITYNYNIFIVYGKRLMRFSDMLLQQTQVGVAPPTLSELDYFYRRLSQSFDDLEQISQNESLPPTHLDPDNLTPEPRTW